MPSPSCRPGVGFGPHDANDRELVATRHTLSPPPAAAMKVNFHMDQLF